MQPERAQRTTTDSVYCSVMSTVMVSLLRGVNLGPYNRVKMNALRGLYERLGLQEVRTLLQSGNVVFRTDNRNLGQLTREIESAIEKQFSFSAPVVLRTAGELQNVVANNPFAGRQDLDPAKLLVTFLTSRPTSEGCKKVAALDTGSEEVHVSGREVYIYYSNGLARPKVSWTTIDKMLGTTGTGRNWNTVVKLSTVANSEFRRT